MKKLIIAIVTLVFSLYGCKKENDVDYFNGEIIYVSSDSVPVAFLEGKNIILNDIYTGYMSVYDTLMLFSSNQFNDKVLHVFNLNTLDLECKLITKGQGPEDVLHFTHSEQFTIQNNFIKLWSRDAITGNFFYLI